MELLSRWAYYLHEGILSGLSVTLTTMVASTCLVILWAAVVAGLRVSSFGPARVAAQAYVEFFRGTPFMVQLLTIFATMPLLTGIVLPPWHTAVLCLTLNVGGYLAESYRSGFAAVQPGQREAADALGMSRVVALRRVVVPQALRVILPAIGNITITILLGTSFTFLVGLPDMMGNAARLQNLNGDFSVYLLVTAIYVALGLLLAAGNSLMERKLRLPSA